MDKLQEISILLKDILQKVKDLPAEIRIAANQINVTTLDEISETLGLIKAGEFRVGNNIDPGEGYTGMRIRYPAMEYAGDSWHLVGVNNDILQVGISAVNGKLYAAGGKLIVDQDAMTLSGLLYAMTHSATVGTTTRNAWLGMWTPAGTSTPTWGIVFSGGTTGSNLVTNGNFELGVLTNWTQSGTSMSVDTTSPNTGSYCLKVDTITSGTKTLTSDRYTAIAGTKYNISAYTKDTASETSSNYSWAYSADITNYAADTNWSHLISAGEEVDASAIYRDLIKFSSLPTDATAVVSSAKLFFKIINDYCDLPFTLRMYMLKRAWVNGQATWNSWKTGSSWSTAGATHANDCDSNIIGSISLSASEPLDWHSFNITPSYIQDIIRGTWTDNGFMLRSSVESKEGWYSLLEAATPDNLAPYLQVIYTSNPDYSIQVKWYDNASAGTLLQTDTLCEENGVTSWNSHSLQVTAPTGALSFEVIITATLGSIFYVDDIDVHTIAVSEQLWFDDTGVHTTTSYKSGYATVPAELNKSYIQFPRLTTTERNAVTSPADGMVIWNTTTGQLEVYDSGWVAV